MFFKTATLLFIGSTFALAAQPVAAAELEQVMRRVATDNPTLVQARKAVDIAQENKKQAFGAFFPTISATANAQDVETDTEDHQTLKGNPRSAAVTLSQPLFKGGALTADLRAQRNAYAAAQADYDTTLQNVMLQLVTAYVNVLRDRDVFSLNKNLVSVLQKQLEATTSRFELGEVTKTDLKQAEARLATAMANQQEAEGTLRAAEATLKQITGEDVAQLTWPSFDFNLPEQASDVLDDALNNHPQVASALANMVAQKHAVRIARATHLPEITASANYTATRNAVLATPNQGRDSNATTFMLDVSLPLFRGGRTLSEVREAVDVRVQSEQAYEAARREVEQELMSAYYGHKAALAVLDSRKASLAANDVATNGVKREAELGERTVLDVLDAEQELLSAQVGVAQAKAHVIVSAYRMQAAMGQLRVPADEAMHDAR